MVSRHLGNHACQSGLMALEQWALEKIEAGADFNDIFKKVIEGNDCVAALGIGVSLCLSKPNQTFGYALPLITCPHLWQWDIAVSFKTSAATRTKSGIGFRTGLS